MKWNTLNVVWLLAVGLGVAGVVAGDTFKKHPKQFPVGPNPSAIVAADLNDDGYPEILTADIGFLADPREERPAHDQVSFLLARGALDYEPLPQLQTGFAPYSIAVANIDALKAPDIIVGCFHAASNRDVTLFRNLGGNLFEPRHFRIPPDRELPYNRMRDGDGAPVFCTPGITSVIVPEAPATGSRPQRPNDVNHDGYRDMVAAAWCSDVLVFLPGAPDTYFGTPKFIPAAGGPRDVKAADFDKDGEVDLAATLYLSDQVAFWKGDGAGNFEPATHFPSRGRLPHKLQVADVNLDGKLDVVVSHCYTDDSVVVFYGDGGFEFSVSQELMLGRDREKLECEIRDIMVTDLNGDERPDIAAACYGSGEVVVLINTSSDSAKTQTFRKEVYTFKEGRPRALCAADFNADKKRDLAVALWETNTVALLLGQ
jgi:hypothetical protein